MLMRIALWNASGLDNLGDRLIDQVCRRELAKRIRHASFQTFTPWPSSSVPTVKIDRDGRWEGEGQFDAIVIGGGALLIGPPFVHPSLQTCYLGPYPDRFRDSCPVVWNAVCSDGQFVSVLAEPWRAYVRAASARLTFRSARNQRTAQMLGDCGVNEPISVVPDPVTLLCPPLRRLRRRGRRRIGLALGESGHSSSFVAELESKTCDAEWNPAVRVQLPRGALSQQASSLLPTLVTAVIAATADLRSSSDIEVCAFGAVYGDARTAQALAEGLHCARIALLDSHGTNALRWIRSLDCLIASRLHACILAVLAGTPFLALDPYFSPVVETSKIREFMSSVRMLGAYRTLESFLTSYDSLEESVEQAIANRERLPEIHEELSTACRHHFDELAEVIATG